jgi:hypothetical protein
VDDQLFFVADGLVMGTIMAECDGHRGWITPWPSRQRIAAGIIIGSQK